MSKGTPQKAIRVDPELWETAKQIAYRRNETISEVIRRALTEYIHKCS
ncbi:ribbon-helix-helix protein, CopG family [Rhodococcus pyridinivorans]